MYCKLCSRFMLIQLLLHYITRNNIILHYWLTGEKKLCKTVTDLGKYPNM